MHIRVRFALKAAQGVMVAGMILACAGCIGRQARPLPLETRTLYQEIIQNTSAIEPEQYPVTRHITPLTVMPFFKPSPASLKDCKTVIVVLGSKALDKSTPTIDLVYRILKASDMLKEHPDALVVMTGGMTLKDISEARIMGVVAWSRGMDTRRIMLEEDSRTTKENALYTARLLRGCLLQHVFLISRANHLPRAHTDFQQYPVFTHIQDVDCGILPEQVIAQLKAYLVTHHNPEVQARLMKLQQQSKGQ